MPEMQPVPSSPSWRTLITNAGTGGRRRRRQRSPATTRRGRNRQRSPGAASSLSPSLRRTRNPYHHADAQQGLSSAILSTGSQNLFFPHSLSSSASHLPYRSGPTTMFMSGVTSVRAASETSDRIYEDQQRQRDEAFRELLQEGLPEFWKTCRTDPTHAADACRGLYRVLQSKTTQAPQTDSGENLAESPEESSFATPSFLLASPPRIGKANTMSGNRKNDATKKVAPLILPWLNSTASVSSEPRIEETKDDFREEEAVDSVGVPFLLFAAAQVAFADMQHIRTLSKRSSTLSQLYERVALDLQTLRERFGASDVVGEDREISEAGVSTLYADGAENIGDTTSSSASVSSILDAMDAYCSQRAHLVQAQERQFVWAQTSLQHHSAAPFAELEAIENENSAFLSNECKAWICCMQGCVALERCQFIDAIVCLRRWKNCLPEQKETSMERWLLSSYDQMRSLLAVYFDRVRAFAGPLYGFDVSSLSNGDEDTHRDWNGRVLDFLKRQEKAGGPPTVIALVLDAERTENVHIQRGLHLASSLQREDDEIPREGIRSRWPAVYIRSTAYLSAVHAQSTASRPSGSVLVTATSGSGMLNKSSQGNLLAGWSSSSPPPSGSRKRPSMSRPTTSMLQEYGPESGVATSWPHSEWNHLANLIDRRSGLVGQQGVDLVVDEMVQEESGGRTPARTTVAVTIRENDETHSRESEVGGFFSGTSTASSADSLSPPASPPPVSSEQCRKENRQSSVYHLAPLSEFLTLVAIVKGEEYRWHRRKSSLPDEDFRDFLSELATELSVLQIFSQSRLPRRDKEKTRISLEEFDLSRNLPFDETATEAMPSETVREVWTDEDVFDFSEHVKGAFGMRPVRSNHTDSMRGSAHSPNSRRRFQWPSSPRSLRRSHHGSERDEGEDLLRRRELPTLDESAMSLFLGRDLAHLL